MTPEELAVRYSPLTAAAQRLLEALAPPMSGEERREVVVRHLMAVVAEAREADARAAEFYQCFPGCGGEHDQTARGIAAAIRALA